MSQAQKFHPYIHVYFYHTSSIQTAHIFLAGLIYGILDHLMTEGFWSLDFVFFSMLTMPAMKGMSMNYVSVWVIHQALPAPLHEVISALTHSVCQGHTPPLTSGADFEGFQPWPESLAVSSSFSNSFQEMSIGFPPPLPSGSSLLFIETRPRPQMP